ncbi:MAG: ATP-grasp domain-containing protein [Saprospiraceae bacterium]
MKNILICSAGRRVSLVEYFKRDSKILIPGAKVFTTDLNPSMSSACLVSDNSFKVGRFSDDDYIEGLLNLCLNNEIGMVIPTIDTELLLLSQHKVSFQNKGIELIVSDESFVRKCRDKRHINNFFLEKGFQVPKEISREYPIFPLFIKPIDGSSSQDLFLIDTSSKLSEYHRENQKLMWMEYLSPKEFREFTVDLYYDRENSLKCIVPRIRIAVRGGETSKGITVKDLDLIEFIKKNLGIIPGAIGCLTLQVFQNIKNGDIYGIEINPRFGGGYPLSYLAGAHYPAWLIKEYLLHEKIEEFESWEDKVLLLRHDAEMIIHDFDY